jgi:hypothetical protein
MSAGGGVPGGILGLSFSNESACFRPEFMNLTIMPFRMMLISGGSFGDVGKCLGSESSATH